MAVMAVNEQYNFAMIRHHSAKHPKEPGLWRNGGEILAELLGEQHFPKAKRYGLLSPDLEAV
jgi:hypothetical protein